MSRISINRVVSIQGQYRPPSDKSLTHRAYMFAAIANGESRISRPLRGEDCESTLRCLSEMGMVARWTGADEVVLTPAIEWSQPLGPLDCGNSGTTIRLLSGLLASRPIDCLLVGDESLSRRPMKRVADPLRMMGATVEGDFPPLRVLGTQLDGIDYVSAVASAQVKSCVLLAGLRAQGETSVREPSRSRDHTERMLSAAGVSVNDSDGSDGSHRVSIQGGQSPNGFDFRVPGDISSAAFMLVAASALPDSDLVVTDLSVNPSRTGLLDVLRAAGVQMEIGEERLELGEPVSDLRVRSPRELRSFTIEGALVPRLIDEIPALAVLATQCAGMSVIRDARELRVKETDRIEAVARGLRAMGASVETFEDGLTVSGPTRLHGATIEARHDHRVAMAFATAGLFAEGETVIEGAQSIDTSYPGFHGDLVRLSVV